MSPFTDYAYHDNATRLAAYLRRSADFHAADPDAWRWRQVAGERVKARVRMGNTKGQVVRMIRRKA